MKKFLSTLCLLLIIISLFYCETNDISFDKNESRDKQFSGDIISSSLSEEDIDIDEYVEDDDKDEEIIDLNPIVSNDFYYMFDRDNGELVISLDETYECNQKSSFDKLYKLYGKYAYDVKIVTFLKSSRLFHPDTLNKAFYSNGELKEIRGFKYVDTSYVKDFSECFSGCNCVDEKILSHLKTDSGVDFYKMFAYCNSIVNFDSSNYDFSNAENLNMMFCYCENLKNVDFSNSNFSNVKSMIATLSNCDKLEKVDFSNSDFSNCNNLVSLFDCCSLLDDVDFSNSIFENVLYMGGMFNNCESIIKIDYSSFDLTNLIDCTYTESYGLYAEEDYESFCRCCKNLKYIYFPKSFDLKFLDSEYIYYGCDSLKALFYKDGDIKDQIRAFKDS